MRHKLYTATSDLRRIHTEKTKTPAEFSAGVFLGGIRFEIYIKHESRGRIRIHLAQKRMSSVQAETLLYYLQNQNQVSFAKVYDRTGDA